MSKHNRQEEKKNSVWINTKNSHINQLLHVSSINTAVLLKKKVLLCTDMFSF